MPHALTGMSKVLLPLGSTLVRYPDFLKDTRALHESLVFPRLVTAEQFEQAFRTVYRPGLVNAYRRGGKPA